MRRLAALLLLSACARPASDRRSPPAATSSAPAASAPAASAPALAPLPPPREAPQLDEREPAPAHAVQLWVRPEGAAPGLADRSLYLDDEGQPIASRPGLWHRQRRLTITVTTTALPPCPAGHAPFPARTLHRTALSSPESELIPQAAGPSLAEEIHRPLAALDDTLFFQIDRVENPCDERPGYRSASLLLRLGPAGVEKISTIPQPDTAAGREAAAAAMRRRGVAGLAAEASAWSLEQALPGFGPEPRWRARYVAPCPWELSYGGWGGGRCAEQVEGAPLTGIPEAARRYARRAGALEVAGVIRPEAPRQNSGR